MTDISVEQNGRFADMADHELIRALQREALDPPAREAALREVHRRRLPPTLLEPAAEPAPAAAPAPVPAAPAIENYAFGADRFADNPYQAPQSAPPPDALPSTRSRVVNALWWLHIALFALYTLSAIYNVTVSGRLSILPLGFLAVLVLCVVGMVGWRLQKALLHQWIWGLLGVGAMLYTAMLALGLVTIVFADLPDNNFSRPVLFALGIASTLIVVPLTWGLTGYAFRSKSLW